MLQTLSERVMASGGKLVADSGRDWAAVTA
jgi:hypothetical protein